MKPTSDPARALEQRICFELLRSAALGAANSIGPPLDLLKSMFSPATESVGHLDSALGTAIGALRGIESTYRDAWKIAPAPSVAELQALIDLDHCLCQCAGQVALWLQEEITTRHGAATCGLRGGDWLRWDFTLSVDVYVKAPTPTSIARAMTRPCLTHSWPSGRVRHCGQSAEGPLLEFDCFDDQAGVARDSWLSRLPALSSDVLRNLIVFVPELAQLAPWVEALRLRCGHARSLLVTLPVG